MRMYSPEELDVMAEAYTLAVDRLPREMPSIELTQRLVQEIAWAVANGMRDEAELARAALARCASGDAIPDQSGARSL